MTSPLPARQLNPAQRLKQSEREGSGRRCIFEHKHTHTQKSDLFFFKAHVSSFAQTTCNSCGKKESDSSFYSEIVILILTIMLQMQLLNIITN